LPQEEYPRVKTIRLPLIVTVLLAAAACSRGPATSVATAPGQALATQGDGEATAPHDPHAMTSIDAATGDLSGFANYAGGRAFAPPASHAGAAVAPTAALPTVPLDSATASVASADEQVGVQAAAPDAAPETSAIDLGQAGPSSVGAPAPARP
jgi:hypothetical protein